MQPIRLSLVNFGPYEETTIDFSDFYAQSLFLITGKTGAGKTTIFDGMSYALYGQTSGRQRQGKEMRSNFADPKIKTKVTFEFKQKNQRYIIEREPEQRVKKQRSEGFTNQASKVTLTVFDEEGEEVNQLTKQRDVGIFLDDLLKLNQEQFTQIVMLPQGEFKQFLSADSNDKENVLRKLFNTYFYRDIAQSIKEQKKIWEKELGSKQQELRIGLSHLEWDETYQEKIALAVTVEDILSLYEEQRLVYEEDLNKAKEEQAKRVIETQALIQKEKEQEQLIDAYKELQKVEEELVLLAATKDQIEEEKQTLFQLKNIEKSAPVYYQLMEQKQDIMTNEASQLETKEQLSVTNKALEAARQTLQSVNEKAKEKAAWEQEIRELERVQPLFEKKEQMTLKKRQQEEAWQKEQTIRQALEEQLTQIETQMVRLQQEEAKRPDYLLEQQELKELAIHIGNVDLSMEEHKRLEQQHLTCTREITKNIGLTEEFQHKLQDVETNRQEKNNDWLKAQIAVLSAQLVQEEPCPVCGSKEHPSPAYERVLSKEELAILEQEVADLETQRDSLKEKIASLQQEMCHLLEQQEELEAAREVCHTRLSTELEGIGLTETDALKQLKEKHKEKSEANSMSLQALEQQVEELNALKEEHTACQKDLEKTQANSQRLEMEKAVLEQQLVDLRAQLPEGFDTVESLLHQMTVREAQLAEWEHQLETATKEIKALETRQGSLLTSRGYLTDSYEVLLTKQTVTQSKLEVVLKELDLDVLNYESLLESLVTIPKLEETITAYEEKKRIVGHDRERLRRQIGQQVLPEIELIKQELVERQKEEEVGQQFIVTQHYKLEQNKKVMSQAVRTLDEMGKERQQLEELTLLSDVLNGDTANKLSMERFVLQTYLRRILHVANDKLLVLTNGRYRFELNEEQGSYKSQTGLEINIFDDNVGALRSVNTLSGGESFIASLSLALSLAEVIQHEAGGIQIDAMFIDEGFGSLDEDALEMAIRSLEMIQGDGRLIGIISHVSELRERIPQQLQIKSNTRGRSEIATTLEL